MEGQNAKEGGVYKKKMVFIEKGQDTSIKEKRKRNEKNIARTERIV